MHPEERADGRTAGSERLFAVLVLVLAALAAAGVFLPRGEVAGVPAPELPAEPWVVALVAGLASLVVYGGLGWVGLRLARRLGWPELLDGDVPARARWGLPLVTGAAVGLAFIAVELVAVRLHDLGPLPHPPFPTSLVASLAAAIGEETVFRLFFVSFWVWLVAEKALGGRGKEVIFWSVVAVSAVAFTASHLPSVLFLYGAAGPTALPPVLLAELLVLNGSLSVVAAWHLRRHGFLAAVGVHLWADVVWHVVYGAV